MNTKTIKLCGKDVQIGYCAATENAFENFSDKSIQVFVPTYGKDKDGKDIIVCTNREIDELAYYTVTE